MMRLGYVALIFLVFAQATTEVAVAKPGRLPPGVHVGRCLYVVAGEQRISGRCYYKINKGGDFSIDGPRQVYGGKDTVDRGASAFTYSRDWWAEVFWDDGGWVGYGNESVADVHGGAPWQLRRHGACFLGKQVKICLWQR